MKEDRKRERENDEQRRRMDDRWMLVNRSCDILVLSVDGDEPMKCVDGAVYIGNATVDTFIAHFISV